MSQPEQGKVSRRVICVSHLTGADGESVARAVADRLGFRYIDEEIIERGAEWADLHPSVVGEVERRKSLMGRLGEVMKGQPSPSRPDASAQFRGVAAREMPSSEDLRALIRDVIREVAEEGDIVIAAHAASMALADRPGVLRVLVTASDETRAARVASARNVDVRSATKALQDEDVNRADYLKRFHGIEREQPTHYDLVVSTDKIPIERAAEVVVLAAE